VKHYSIISEFYKKNTCSIISKIHISSLIDLIYSTKEKKIIIYDDSMYGKITDNLSLDWDVDNVLIISPKGFETASTPSGFKQYNQHSIKHFSKIYSSLKSDIRAILCASSQKNSKITQEDYNNFIINNNTVYDECVEFCKKNYEKVDVVSGINQYARRGGVIDLYPEISSNPKRIVFLDDQTEIKEFNIETQISYRQINEVKIPIKINENNLITTVKIDYSGWEIFKINQSDLLINKHTNNKKVQFPFHSINYSEYKQNNQKYNIVYEKTNRINGFLYQKKMIVPEWFKNNRLQNNQKERIIEISEINIGDYVVHRDYGIGKFVGLKNIKDTNNGNEQELLIINYQDNCNLSVDINRLENITFYADKSHDIKIDSLTKNGRWEKRRKSAIKNVQNIVNKLLNTYANRENSYREIILPDNDEKTFIDEFPYLETKDQINAWEDIKDDLINNTPMDRLICGDVGFGKTEIAIRSAYRYASNSKKTIVLAPTTILSRQLYLAFNNRLINHGIILANVSRFKSKKELKNIRELWANNQIDIIIGTHAILYNNIYLENCDFLIIDEEHRFGVQQKEKIKDINPGIDILTMSATPIPRTLNMALSGMKKISTLSTPPKYRKPINTTISYYNEKLIIKAINNEIFRNGQVYFVHNNVDTLPLIVTFLEQSLPHLNVQYIHGKMDPELIERTMENFTKQDIHILVCTSIIENGIDISNVNTIIINNAQKFGLSQLYQIRGRVGRSTQQAYAFLMVPHQIKLNDNAYSRLKAIENYTQLGSGYKISNMDLTIRGGGSIFGYDQSGNIENVGYELVSKFINEYMNQNNIINTKINFINKGIIPTNYIYSEKIRLLIYRKIKSITSFNELELVLSELKDRFGNIPLVLMRIIEIQKIYLFCQNLHISLIDEKQDMIIIQFQSYFWEQKLSSLLNKINEFINQQEINYQIEEFKESLILKLKIKNTDDSIKLINKFIYTL